jgi:anti-sigma factor RsiW
VNRHASADDLAALAAGAVTGRKAKKVAAHLSTCDACTQLSQRLTGVSHLLASVETPPMPEHLTAKIDTALAAESARRLASEPATEAGRRDLPARRHRVRQPGRQPGSWLSGPAVRLLAAAGAMAVIAGGGYAVATRIGAASSTAALSAGLPGSHGPAAGNVTYGPRISYGRAKSVTAVSAGTDFASSTLDSQVISAVERVEQTKHESNQYLDSGELNSTAASTGTASTEARPPNASSDTIDGISAADLSECVNKVAASQTVLLVELARFEGKPATIIVIAASRGQLAQVWVVARPPLCGPLGKDAFDHQALTHV